MTTTPAGSRSRHEAIRRTAERLGVEMDALVKTRHGDRFVAELARRTGIMDATLRRVLDGSQRSTVEQALLICDALDVPLSFFLGPLHSEEPRHADKSSRDGRGNEWRTTAARAGSPIEHVIAPGITEDYAKHDGMEWIYVAEGGGLLMLDGNGGGAQLYPRFMAEFDASIRHRVVNTEREPLVLIRHMSAAGAAIHKPTEIRFGY